MVCEMCERRSGKAICFCSMVVEKECIGDWYPNYIYDANINGCVPS